MALFDFLKHKEFAEIYSLKNKIALLEKDLDISHEREDKLISEISILRDERDKLLKYKDISDVYDEKNVFLER